MANIEDLIMRDTRANQPAAGVPGRLYYVTDENVTERDNGSSWEDCTDGGAASNNTDPWLVHILPSLDEVSGTSGTWTTTVWSGESQSGPFASGSAVGMQNTSNAQNDYVTWDIVLSAGTWNVNFWVRKSTNTGIITLELDGTSKGTVDTYDGSVSYANVSITGFTVSATGKTTAKIIMATKHASSSAYNVGLIAISFRRTA